MVLWMFVKVWFLVAVGLKDEISNSVNLEEITTIICISTPYLTKAYSQLSLSCFQ